MQQHHCKTLFVEFMENRRTVLITGSSRGIGAGIARHLSSLGMRVAMTYSRSKDKALKVMEELTGEGHLVLKMDLEDESSVEQAFKQVVSEFGGLFGLVNNGGVTSDQILLRMKTSDFDRVIRTNLRGTFLCTKQALKVMIKARRGSVVNITSVVGQMGGAVQSNYSASKAGILAFSKSVALEVASRGIRINCVAPGFIKTDMTEQLNQERKKIILSSIPMGTMGGPLDVAHCVAFLLGDESKYVTGQSLGVNGGLLMSS